MTLHRRSTFHPVGEDTYPRLAEIGIPACNIKNAPPLSTHPRRVRVVHPGAAFFVTTVTAERKPLLLRPDLTTGVLADLWVGLQLKGTECYALALLPDHAHLILRPMGTFSLSAFMHCWKRNASRNANKVLRDVRFGWQPSFMEHALRDHRDLLAHYCYILGNPIKHGAKGVAKCYCDGLVQQRWKGGQDMYPGLRVGANAASDKEIDRLVYDLYGLTDDEIAIVEGQS